MATRGRRSLAALTTSPVERIDRLPPPIYLSKEQKAEWIEIVNTMPAEHFMRGNQGLLEQYCCHMVTARHLNMMINHAESSTKKYASTPKGRREKAADARFLLSMYKQQKEESLCISRLLTCMRLTQQSIKRAETTKHPKGGRRNAKPWEEDEEGNKAA